MAYRVTCVTIDDSSSYDDCRCIEQIGYKIGSGEKRNTPAQLHDMIKDGEKFYILDGGRTYLEAVEREGTKYVRTEPNDTEDDNLLEQPLCG